MRLYVGNLSYETNESTLREAFSNYGDVISVQIMYDRYTGQSKGFAFIEMGTDLQSERAIGGMNGKAVDGRRIRVNEAQDKQPNAGGERKRSPRRYDDFGERPFRRGGDFENRRDFRERDGDFEGRPFRRDDDFGGRRDFRDRDGRFENRERGARRDFRGRGESFKRDDRFERDDRSERNRDWGERRNSYNRGERFEDRNRFDRPEYRPRREFERRERGFSHDEY